jgi:hypothetical protein
MDRNQPDDPNRVGTIASRYKVSQQEVAQWIEQGYAASDVDWAYRFAETSTETDVQKLLMMRREGMTWDDVRRYIDDMRRGDRNPAEQAAGKKLVPGGERHSSRYFYRDMARNIRPHSGPQQETGYEGTPSEKQHGEKSDSWSDQQSTRKSPNANDE